VTVGGEDGPVNVRHILHEIPDLAAILFRQAVTRSIRYVDNCGAGVDHGLSHPGEILIVAPACVFCIEFHVIGEFPGVPDCICSSFDYLFRGGPDLVLNMPRRGAYAGVDPLSFSILQCFGSHFYVFFHRPRKCAYNRLPDSFRYLNNRTEVARTGNRESCLDYINTQCFERLCNFDLFNGVELASRNLFSVTEGSVKENHPVLVHDFRFEVICRQASVSLLQRLLSRALMIPSQPVRH